MGKKNSKLKQDTIDRLTTDTYCKYCQQAFAADRAYSPHQRRVQIHAAGGLYDGGAW